MGRLRHTSQVFHPSDTKMPADSRSLVQTASICRYSICCLTGQRFVLSFSLIHNIQRISAYPAEQKENFHPSRLCLGQSLPESWVSVHIGPHLGDSFHLDHKGHPAANPGLLGLGQFLQVLDAPFGGGIREVADAVHFQGAALHLHQVELARLFHGEVNPGLAIGELWVNRVKALGFQPLLYHLVRSLAVNVDPAQALFADRYQIIFCLAGRVIRHFKPDIRPWQQQFLAAAGVFDMDGFFFAFQHRLGDKPVGAGEEGSVQDGFVFHGLLPFC